MTEQDENSKDDGTPRRIRGKIYSDRTTVSLRLEKGLHTRLLECCDELATPANTYITNLIEADLKKRKK